MTDRVSKIAPQEVIVMPRIHKVIGSLVVVAMLAAGSMTVRAIVYGFVDTHNTFSNVGAFVVRAPSGRISPICSGTLSAEDVFLTASHCTVFFEQELVPRGYTAFVSFDNPIPFGPLTTASTDLIPVVQVVSNPRFNQSQSDSGDIAVLLVSAADTAGIEPATLPTADLLEQLAAQNGLKRASHGGGIRRAESRRWRRSAVFYRRQSGTQDVRVRNVQRAQ